MRERKSTNKEKRITHIKVLAIVFLLFIFYVGSATLPDAIKNTSVLFAADRPGILATKDTIDEDYRSMLDFTGYNLKDKGTYINLNGLMARLMGQRHMNGVVKLDNGHLTRLEVDYNIDRDKGLLSSEQMIKIHRKQKENNKVFLFVLAPCQVPKYEDIVPPGYEDYSNKNGDDFLYRLEKNGIQTLDLRETMQDEGIETTDAFFVTDNHWTAETGFWGYTKIIDFLIQTGAIDSIDSKYIDISEYDVEIYENHFIGGHGKRTGIYYAGFDDFALITPKFETDMSLEIPSTEIDKKGMFSEIVFHKRKMKQGHFTQNPYSTYGYGLRNYKRYINYAAPVDLKVLTIGDSFSQIPYTFLPLVFSSCVEVDMRRYKDDFEELYYEYEPDIIIALSNPSQLAGKVLAYDYFNDLEEIDTTSNYYEVY